MAIRKYTIGLKTLEETNNSVQDLQQRIKEF